MQLLKWSIDFSKSSLKFLAKNNLEKSEIISIIGDAIKRLRGEKVNISIKKLKGKWKGFHRIRQGDIRVLLSFDFNLLKIYIDKIDFRGDVYK